MDSEHRASRPKGGAKGNAQGCENSTPSPITRCQLRHQQNVGAWTHHSCDVKDPDGDESGKHRHPSYEYDRYDSRMGTELDNGGEIRAAASCGRLLKYVWSGITGIAVTVRNYGNYGDRAL